VDEDNLTAGEHQTGETAPTADHGDGEPPAEAAAPETEAPAAAATQRGFIAEWAVTIILLLFGTTNLVQAFVIPTGSMEDTLLIGDHLLVDKLAYSPAGSRRTCCRTRTYGAATSSYSGIRWKSSRPS